MTDTNKKHPNYHKPNYDKNMSPQLIDQISRYNKVNNKQFGV